MVLPIAGVVLRRRVTSAALLLGRRHKAKQPYCDAHMNELPIPCGPWGPWYQAQQGSYNRMFGIGIVAFTVALVLAVGTGSLDLASDMPSLTRAPPITQHQCYEQ